MSYQTFFLAKCHDFSIKRTKNLNGTYKKHIYKKIDRFLSATTGLEGSPISMKISMHFIHVDVFKKKKMIKAFFLSVYTIKHHRCSSYSVMCSFFYMDIIGLKHRIRGKTSKQRKMPSNWCP